MVQTPSKLITLDEFLELPETKPASEFIDGKIITKPMPQGQHSTIQGELVTTINAVTKASRIAWAFPELRCTFGGRSIVPDVSVFIWDRLPTNTDGTIANQFNASGDWVIEILSPGQSVTRVTGKILHCLSQGSQLGWLIDPNEKLVLVYMSNQQPRFFEEMSERLPTPEFASEFNLTLEQLFSWLRVK
ncbi:MAG: Uma2 family endonuclease [Microcoleaceae cyanobacterium]